MFRQSHEASALSMIVQDAQMYYYDIAASQHLASITNTAEVASQTGIEELTEVKEAKEIEV